MSTDVLVVGGGNAALVSALSAADAGARVRLLERAPAHFRGGNSRHTRNIRCAHDTGDEFTTGPYPGAELRRDLGGVGDGPSDERLAELTVRESRSVPAWMTAHGAHWQPALSGTLNLARTNRFFLGGGKALLNSYYRTAERAGVTVEYDTQVTRLEWTGETCTAAHTADGRRIPAASVVCASGGFEANLAWLGRYWGEAAQGFHVRGPSYNDGRVLRELLDAGAQRAGEERGFHAVAVDARGPRYDGGIATRIDAIPFGIVVDRDGRRFHDEGEDIWPKRYASWGRNIALRPGQIAYALWDAKVQGSFLPPMYGPYTAGSVEELAETLGLDGRAVAETVGAFNTAVDRGGPPSRTFTMSRPDGRRTAGLDPPKSNWAQRLDTPPYYAVPMRPGVTFTYLGVAVTDRARVRRVDGGVFGNVFAAGEIMSGNILSTGYLAGFGMTIGTVWGRIAGREAARHALG
ncbi:FAD-dependent tricarballylate dehydrogenase TcuA [Streptomyces cylindrosporus]|uniref:FAD-dependent tricarballylate dehydrogenase TcuA n=1 Tax=Streptomyces cylindrosporus TaxID=2927583 RepID=A0ABS9YDK4_9ACTN|nr:FAD-dependent tricarballylate dehydrogenase TcuA [Streptomyces cylindrosporus]MCI3275304.1 FAD-dependent tricarballylate dehydrogenase TcuA [Streptomyces cylindrosporus]